MNVLSTPIPDLFVIEPRVHRDERGDMCTHFSEEKFKLKELPYHFVQDSQSIYTKGVIRGLHYQLAPYAQTKIVRVIEGVIFDVAVDIRRNSPTFGHYYGIELSGDNFLQLLIPKGFAHGFSVLSPKAIIHYKCDNYSFPEFKKGILYNDSSLKIDWHIKLDDEIVTPKDKMWPEFHKAEMNFNFGNL